MINMLTGIRSTGTPHLGNILSVIIPSINMSNNRKYSSFIFIADLHSLVDLENFKNIKENVYQIAAAWLAFGLNIKKCFFYRQSDIPEVTELAWYFSCFFPYKRLTLAHSFKERMKIKKKINVGLFTYPILMASDILLYDSEIVPVGIDQLQHIEITRRIAFFFNKKFNKKLFVLPNEILQKKFMLILGTDGQKMSKSKNNLINIFSSEKTLKQQIMKIRTDNKSIKEKKNPENNYIFSLYQLIAPYDKVKEMKNKYLKGGYSYLDAKNTLYNFIIKKFYKEREKFFYYIHNKKLLDHILFLGAKKARILAKKKLNYIRKYLNFNSLS